MKTLETLYRDTQFYKEMTPYIATAYAEGFCEGEGASTDEQLTAWQWLHDTGNAYKLQGWFGRQAQALIEAGAIAK